MYQKITGLPHVQNPTNTSDPQLNEESNNDADVATTSTTANVNPGINNACDNICAPVRNVSRHKNTKIPPLNFFHVCNSGGSDGENSEYSSWDQSSTISCNSDNVSINIPDLVSQASVSLPSREDAPVSNTSNPSMTSNPSIPNPHEVNRSSEIPPNIDVTSQDVNSNNHHYQSDNERSIPNPEDLHFVNVDSWSPDILNLAQDSYGNTYVVDHNKVVIQYTPGIVDAPLAPDPETLRYSTGVSDFAKVIPFGKGEKCMMGNIVSRRIYISLLPTK